MAAVENYLVSIAEDVHLVRVCSYLTYFRALFTAYTLHALVHVRFV